MGPLPQQGGDCPAFPDVLVVSASPKKLAGWKSPGKCETDLCSTKLANFAGREELEDEGKQALLLQSVLSVNFYRVEIYSSVNLVWLYIVGAGCNSLFK